jgi:hypothetical protein
MAGDFMGTSFGRVVSRIGAHLFLAWFVVYRDMLHLKGVLFPRDVFWVDVFWTGCERVIGVFMFFEDFKV